MTETIDEEMLWGVPPDQLPAVDKDRDYFDYLDEPPEPGLDQLGAIIDQELAEIEESEVREE